MLIKSLELQRGCKFSVKVIKNKIRVLDMDRSKSASCCATPNNIIAISYCAGGTCGLPVIMGRGGGMVFGAASHWKNGEFWLLTETYTFENMGVF